MLYRSSFKCFFLVLFERAYHRGEQTTTCNYFPCGPQKPQTNNNLKNN